MVKLVGSVEWGETAGADIGDAVAIGIGFAGDGTVSEISAETVGAAEAGTFAEQNQGDLRAENFADFILQRDPGVLCDDDRSQASPFGAEEREQGAKQGFRLRVGRERGEPVGNDDNKIRGRKLDRLLSQHGPRRGREAAA
jgi:hypothetical protein